jgi:hypothetical protein
VYRRPQRGPGIYWVFVVIWVALAILWAVSSGGVLPTVLYGLAAVVSAVLAVQKTRAARGARGDEASPRG